MVFSAQGNRNRTYTASVQWSLSGIGNFRFVAVLLPRLVQLTPPRLLYCPYRPCGNRTTDTRFLVCTIHNTF